MDADIARKLDLFRPLSLDALNAKAAMLERLDNKYIIPADRLAPALDAFAETFDVLEIEGKRSFTYATRYFDDAGARSYHDHHQGRRKRGKIRVRTYVDAGFSYLEVKLKDIRDITVKRRLKVPNGQTALDDTCTAFINDCYRKQYREDFARPLGPMIGMEYQRITLVASQGGERMTLDTDLSFWSDRRLVDVGPGMFVLETKSARGNGLADRILRSLHQHPTPRCSKYCIAMAALGEVNRANGFLPALRKLNLLGRAAVELPGVQGVGMSVA